MEGFCAHSTDQLFSSVENQIQEEAEADVFCV